MADDIKFVIGVDNKDVLKAIKDNERLEKRIQELSKEYSKLDKVKNSGKISATVYAKAVNQVDQEVKQLKNTMKSGDVAITKMAHTMQKSGKMARRNEIAFQQAGYQVQDFIVQVQGGTNPLIAFSQQGSQLAGFFAGPWGAMIGLGIAAVSSLAMAFLSTKEDAKRLQKSLESVGNNLSDFEDQVKSAEEKVSSFANVMAQINSSQIQQAWADLGEETVGAFDASFMAKFGKFVLQNTLGSEFKTWAEMSGTLSAESFAKAFGQEAMPVNLSYIQNTVALKRLPDIDGIINLLSSFTEITAEGELFLKLLIDARDVAAGFTPEIKGIVGELVKASNAGEDLSKLDLALGIDKAKKVAELLADNMKLSLVDAMNLVNLASSANTGPVGRGRGTSAGAGSTQIERTMLGMGGETIAPYKSNKGLSGAPKESPQEKLAKYIRGKEQELTLEKQLVGVFDEERKIQSELFKIQNDYKNVITKSQAEELQGTLRQIEAERQRQEVLEEVREDQQRLQDTITSSMEDGFMAMIDGTMSVKDAFKQMAAEIIKELLYIMVVKKAVAAVTGFLGFADGGAFSGGSQIQAYADGGVVGGPTTFPMSGGKTGLMGEAGPEAIMPLKRGANGKLGVQMEGGAGDTINVVQNFSFQANGDDSVKKIIAQAAPQIAQMTKSSLLNDRRRGGATKAAFG
jgi:hypothetical protein